MKWPLLGAALFLLACPASSQTVTTAFQRPLLMFQSTTVNGNGADTTEDTLYTTTIPAGLLQNVGDTLHVVVKGTAAASTDTKVLRIRFGNTLVSNFNCVAVGQVAWYFDAYIMKTGSNTQSTTALINSVTNTNTTINPSSITDTAAIVLLVSGQNNTTSTLNSIQASSIQVWYMPGT
jgi:hypothetical protein